MGCCHAARCRLGRACSTAATMGDLLRCDGSVALRLDGLVPRLLLLPSPCAARAGAHQVRPGGCCRASLDVPLVMRAGLRRQWGVPLYVRWGLGHARCCPAGAAAARSLACRAGRGRRVAATTGAPWGGGSAARWPWCCACSLLLPLYAVVRPRSCVGQSCVCSPAVPWQGTEPYAHFSFFCSFSSSYLFIYFSSIHRFDGGVRAPEKYFGLAHC